jgi:predicted peptidase
MVTCQTTSPLKTEIEIAFQAKTYQSATGGTLNYRIYLPQDMDMNQKYPLVLLLHGAGERGNDNSKQLTHGVKELWNYSQTSIPPFIIVAPQCPSDEQWVNTPWSADAHTMPELPSAAMQLTIDLLQELQTSLPVETTRIYVTGLSMGGFGTWDIIQRMPKTFAAAIVICGGGDTEMASIIKDVPIWVFHGGADTTVKTSRSRDMVAALQQVDGQVTYTEYEGVAHGSWDRAYNNKEALHWLLEQQNNRL